MAAERAHARDNNFQDRRGCTADVRAVDSYRREGGGGGGFGCRRVEDQKSDAERPSEWARPVLFMRVYYGLCKRGL